MEISELLLKVPEGYQLIVGQSHFIKTVEDLYEVLSSAVPGAKFGVAFCEASGKALVRFDGTDAEPIRIATDFAMKISAGHVFVIILKDIFPINVLNRVKAVEEVVNIYCATANDVSIVIAESEGRRAVLGVMDGVMPEGIETKHDAQDRREFLRKIGYKR